MIRLVENSPDAWTRRADSEPSPWKASLWSERGQRARFEAVLGLLELEDGDRLLDFGCGPGAFAALLPAGVQYVGLDWSEGMRRRVELLGLDAVADLAHIVEVDHAVCIGPFNLRDGWSKRRTLQTTRDIWTKTLRSMVVSLFRARADPGPSMLTYDLADVHDMMAMLGWPKTLASTEHLENDIVVRFTR